MEFYCLCEYIRTDDDGRIILDVCVGKRTDESFIIERRAFKPDLFEHFNPIPEKIIIHIEIGTGYKKLSVLDYYKEIDNISEFKVVNKIEDLYDD